MILALRLRSTPAGNHARVGSPTLSICRPPINTLCILHFMQRKLSLLEIWVAEVDASIAGWAAIHGDRLEGMYVDPAFVGKGIGTGLLELVEGRMRARGLASISAEASANAERFYLQRGYEPVGIRTQKYGLPIRKRLE